MAVATGIRSHSLLLADGGLIEVGNFLQRRTTHNGSHTDDGQYSRD